MGWSPPSKTQRLDRGVTTTAEGLRIFFEELDLFLESGDGRRIAIEIKSTTTLNVEDKYNREDAVNDKGF